MAENTPVITTLEEVSALLVNVNKNNPGLIPQRHTWDTGHLGGLLYSLAMLILKILGTTAFPNQPLSLRWQQRIQILPNLPCLAFPTPAKQSDSAPQAHSPSSEWQITLSPEVSSKERDSSHRHKPGHEEALKGWRPSKNAVKTNQKEQKGVAGLSATRNRVHRVLFYSAQTCSHTNKSWHLVLFLHSALSAPRH